MDEPGIILQLRDWNSAGVCMSRLDLCMTATTREFSPAEPWTLSCIIECCSLPRDLLDGSKLLHDRHYD